MVLVRGEAGRKKKLGALASELQVTREQSGLFRDGYPT